MGFGYAINKLKMKGCLVILIFFLSSIVFAQNKKSDLAISLTVSPFPTKTNANNDFGAIALAGFEFFISEKVSLSGNFFHSNNTLIKNDSGITIRSYGFIPSIQYYFVNKENWDVFAVAGYGFGFEDLTRGQIQNSALVIYNIGPGAHYKIGEKLKLALLFPYFNAQNVTLNVAAASGIGVFLGLQFKL